MGGGPTKELWLGLRSTQKAAAPAADHDVPAGMNMGKALQPLGTAPVVGGRSPPDSGWAMRNAQLRWPNDRAPKTVPANASIKGEQFVHGSATPDIRFTIGDKQDFLAPFEATAKGSFPGPFALGWPAIAKAQGYFLQAMGHRESTGEMIIWTSSEVQDPGWGLMTWLPNDFLRRMIAEKVVLPPDVTNCTVPKDVFAGVQGAMVQTIAYGEELNLVHPPRPADPKVAWEQIWAAKVRVKSTGMVPLGMGDGDADAGRNRGRAQSQQQAPTQAPPESKPPNPLDDAADAVNKLKGIFKF